MADRRQLIRDAFAALAEGDLQAFEGLFDADAEWLGVPGAGGDGTTGRCANRAKIVARLDKHVENGRCFTPEDFIEEGDHVAVRLTIASPEWPAPVKVYKVFTFAESTDVVVRLTDCADESDARQLLAI
jgi:ketosteroid isomerase-like protein